MMFRPSSGSLTARRAFLAVSAVSVEAIGSSMSGSPGNDVASAPEGQRKAATSTWSESRPRKARRALLERRGGGGGWGWEPRVGEKDKEEIRVGVDPDHRSGPAGVAVGARAGEPAVHRRPGAAALGGVPPERPAPAGGRKTEELLQSLGRGPSPFRRTATPKPGLCVAREVRAG